MFGVSEDFTTSVTYTLQRKTQIFEKWSALWSPKKC
jgi:hypothetical protein